MLRSADGELLAAATGRDQADTGFNEADIAFQCDDALGAVHQELAATTQRHALHRGNHRHLGVLEAHRGLLKFADVLVKQVEVLGGEAFGHFLEVGAESERGFVPDDDALQLLLGARHGFLHAEDHIATERVIAAGYRQDANLGVKLRQLPQADAGVFPDRLALHLLLAEYAFGKNLALVDRQRRTRLQCVGGGGVRAFGSMHAIARKHPGRQRCVTHGLAGSDIVANGFSDGLPARRLPGFERPLRPAEAPAHGEVDIACIVGDAFKMQCHVVEDVAEDGPQELRLRVAGSAQLGKLLGRVLVLQDGQYVGMHLAGGVAVVLRRQIQHLDRLAVLLEDAAAGLLAERALRNQPRQPGRRSVVLVPRVIWQCVLHRLDDVRHGVQTDHVSSAVGGTLRAADQRAGQAVDFVEAKAELLRVVHDGEDREHPDAVGNEVRCIQRTNDALAQTRHHPRLKVVQHSGIGVARGDQLDQVHVARRVEEMDAAEVRAQVRRQAFGQAVDRQARGVGSDDRIRRDERSDLAIEVVLPLHLLGDGLDDQVAALQLFQMLLVVGRVDIGDTVLGRQRRRLQLLEAIDGLLDDAVRVAFLGRKVEKHDRHFGIGEVRSDLRAHHPGPEHRDFLDDEVAQAVLLLLDDCSAPAPPATQPNETNV